MCMMCMMGHAMDHSAHANPPVQAGSQPEPLLEILRRRYALGEIDQDQFAEMKRVLGIGKSPETHSMDAGHEHP